EPLRGRGRRAVIVLDTHAAVWWSSQPKRLSTRATAAIASADRLAVPTVVFWEVAMLVRKGRLMIGADSVSARAWADRLCAIPRVETIALTTEMALLADSLKMHADPADRFIVACALERGCPLVTRDELIRPLGIIE